MNVEQRLTDALRSVDRIEPSPDLFSRVVHSIEEDRRHRRRVARTLVSLVLSALGVSMVMRLAMVDGLGGRQVRWQVMEVVETALLVVIVIVLGPAIRRFGRNYIGDLWPADRTTPEALARLLDLAYALVFSGYILVTAQLSRPGFSLNPLADQVADMSTRVAGLVLTIGILHAVTVTALPLVALVSNSTRTGRPLPRWVVVLLVVLGVGIGFQLVNTLIGLVAMGLS